MKCLLWVGWGLPKAYYLGTSEGISLALRETLEYIERSYPHLHSVPDWKRRLQTLYMEHSYLGMYGLLEDILRSKIMEHEHNSEVEMYGILEIKQ